MRFSGAISSAEANTARGGVGHGRAGGEAGHRADACVSVADLRGGEAGEGEDVERRVGHGLGRRAEHVLHEALAKLGRRERRAQRRAAGQGGLGAADLVAGEALGLQRGAGHASAGLEQALATQVRLGLCDIDAQPLQALDGGGGQGADHLAVLDLGQGCSASPRIGSERDAAQAQGQLGIVEQGDDLAVAQAMSLRCRRRFIEQPLREDGGRLVGEAGASLRPR